MFVLRRSQNHGVCPTAVTLHIIFSLDDRETIWLSRARGMHVQYYVTLGNYFFSPSSFYSNVNFETVARGFLGYWWSVNPVLVLKSFAFKRGEWETVVEQVIRPKWGAQGNLAAWWKGRETWSHQLWSFLWLPSNSCNILDFSFTEPGLKRQAFTMRYLYIDFLYIRRRHCTYRSINWKYFHVD